MSDGDNGILSNMALIAAVADNGVIGRGNALIWRLPADMKFFRSKTKGHTVVMGRNTYESIGGPLALRRNIVLTRDANYRAEGCEIAHSVDECLTLAKGDEEIFIIGGAKVYEEFLPIAGKMILTHVHHSFDGDTYFPKWDPAQWEVALEQAGETDKLNPYSFTFREYVRVR
jgi:dihydrofolate reductase